jgi:hypothetical protein
VAFASPRHEPVVLSTFALTLAPGTGVPSDSATSRTSRRRSGASRISTFCGAAGSAVSGSDLADARPAAYAETT